MKHHFIQSRWSLLSLVVVEEAHDGDTLHETPYRVSEELATRLEGAIDSDMVLGGHEEVAGLGRVVRGLLGNIVAAGTIGVVPVAGESLAEDGVEWLLYASECGVLAYNSCCSVRPCSYGGLMCHPQR